MRAIDGDALMKAMYHRAFETDGDTMWQSGCWVRYRAIEQTVKEQPTIEPERKKGKWIRDAVWFTRYYCSQCGEKTEDTIMGEPRYKWCPMCGAEMEG